MVGGRGHHDAELRRSLLANSVISVAFGETKARNKGGDSGSGYV
jgi:hypothetical protein